MATGPEPLCWAVLAPAKPEVLKKLALKAARKEWKDTIFEDDDWVEVVAGKGRYSAMVEREAGSEGTDIPFAKAFSRELEGPVYALHFDPECSSIDVFENGKRSGERAGAPYDLAAELEVALPLPPKSAERATEEKTFSVAVVEGASVDEVRRALQVASSGGAIHVVKSAVGALVYGDGDDIGLCTLDIAAALPRSKVYWVMHGLGSGEFTVTVHQGDEELGVFEISDVGGGRKRTVLNDVKGAREPAAIATALDIPLERLGLRK